MRHKRKLARVSGCFGGYPATAFIFQTFNKDSNVPLILNPFLQKKVKNIIFFADGCVDSSARRAHRLLNGRQHYVVKSNDTHEISNYRLATRMACALGCKHAVLLQDDDVYDSGFFDWLNKSLAAMNEDKSIAIVGGNGGVNFVPEGCRIADKGLTTAQFEMWRDGRKRGFRLGTYQEMTFSTARASADLSSLAFVAVVNRAPQLIDIDASISLGFFPAILEPYQYDDDFNCLAAWSRGRKILHMPTDSKKGNIGTGGMRLYNSVNQSSRPPHFGRNWNVILDTFGAFINSGELERLLAQANSSLEKSVNKTP